MTNTSATGGPLAPVGSHQPADLNLDVFLQAIVAGILSMPGVNVRPRWQPTPPSQPDRPVDWCAMGITRVDSDTNAVLSHDSSGDGQDDLIRHEQFEVLCSLYGPNAVGNAARLRDGLSVPQNREALASQDIAYVSADRIVRVPSLVNQQWIGRADLPLTFRRKISRTYAVLNLLSASGVVDAGTLEQPFATENPG